MWIAFQFAFDEQMRAFLDVLCKGERLLSSQLAMEVGGYLTSLFALPRRKGFDLYKGESDERLIAFVTGFHGIGNLAGKLDFVEEQHRVWVLPGALSVAGWEGPPNCAFPMPQLVKSYQL